MRCARNLVLLALASTAMALTAGTASAQGLEATNEATGGHCPAVTVSGQTASGGCVVHLVTDQSLTFQTHNFGIEQNAPCGVELTIRLDEDGKGYLTDVAPVNGCYVDCSNDSDPSGLWPIAMGEAGGSGGASFTICMSFGGNRIKCPIDTPLSQPTSHAYRLAIPPLANINCTWNGSPTPFEVISGRWVSEAQGEVIELAHL